MMSPPGGPADWRRVGMGKDSRRPVCMGFTCMVAVDEL